MSVGPLTETFNKVSSNLERNATMRFRLEIHLLGESGPKKIVSFYRNLVCILIRILRFNPMMMLTFSLFDRKYSFWVKFGPKNLKCQFKLIFGTSITSKMENSMVIFTFCVLDQKCSFWENLVQKIKIASFSWNLVPAIMVIIPWDFLMF